MKNVVSGGVGEEDCGYQVFILWWIEPHGGGMHMWKKALMFKVAGAQIKKLEVGGSSRE